MGKPEHQIKADSFHTKITNHEIYLREINKLATNSFDDEKYYNNNTESVLQESQKDFDCICLHIPIMTKVCIYYRRILFLYKKSKPLAPSPLIDTYFLVQNYALPYIPAGTFSLIFEITF